MQRKYRYSNAYTFYATLTYNTHRYFAYLLGQHNLGQYCHLLRPNINILDMGLHFEGYWKTSQRMRPKLKAPALGSLSLQNLISVNHCICATNRFRKKESKQILGKPHLSCKLKTFPLKIQTGQQRTKAKWSLQITKSRLTPALFLVYAY